MVKSNAKIKRMRAGQRTRSPKSKEFTDMMQKGWGFERGVKPEKVELDILPETNYTSARRAKISELFPYDRLIIHAGTHKARSNDTDYRFRPCSEFAYLTGLGMDYGAGGVLVFEPTLIKQQDSNGKTIKINTHTVTLYLPESIRAGSEFFSNPAVGEFWIGTQPTHKQFQKATKIQVLPISRFSSVSTSSPRTGARFGKVRIIDTDSEAEDLALKEAISELRLIKDPSEIDQMRKAVSVTIKGFEKVVQHLDDAKKQVRGERVVEGIFDTNARVLGNGVGYETIAAAGNNATTLHWIRNTGKVSDGDLLLLDAGVELDTLYTADITRTLPINGVFSPIQRKVYQAVLDAADAAFRVAKPGVKFRDVHDAAMVVIAERLETWGILPISASQSLKGEDKPHRRWMIHGTSHHLGMDVHDCACARDEMYIDGILRPGMIFTIEPGLYFKADDLTVPREFRGIGVRIEDDVLITKDGYENLTSALPRNPEHVESWMKKLVEK